MLTLGISGGLERIEGDLSRLCEPTYLHDAAAVLVKDGNVLAAIEEERLDRVKHSNRAAELAIRACLEAGGVKAEDLDAVGYYSDEAGILAFQTEAALAAPEVAFVGAKELVQTRILQPALGCAFPMERIKLTNHHVAHGEAALFHSGFEDALIFVADGEGNGRAGFMGLADRNGWQTLAEYPISESLGHFYVKTCLFLGFGQFEEYKVMGLAPYGDPAVYRTVFSRMHELLPGGRWRFTSAPERILPEFIGSPRKRSEGSPGQREMNVAAALQETLEAVCLHALAHAQDETGAENLCFSGGVAHNCSLNGRIKRSGLFDRLFVHPASHDAGCALGSALHAARGASPRPARRRLTDLFWGIPCPQDGAVKKILERWNGLIEWRESADPARDTAELLAAGEVAGWMQGRSEFGPRALGNRSILADPRPASNRERINGMIKKREGFRPFAPAVAAEEAGDWFDLSGSEADLSFMNYVVPVLPHQRATLGAVTHVDGTARIQTVERERNPLFWQLIRNFADLTGVPVLLNTSFNNNAEPIVDSVEDALACFVTGGLDLLTVGAFLIRKRSFAPESVLALQAEIPSHWRLVRLAQRQENGSLAPGWALVDVCTRIRPRPIAEATALVLAATDKAGTVGAACAAAGCAPDRKTAEEILDLWTERRIRLRPPDR